MADRGTRPKTQTSEPLDVNIVGGSLTGSDGAILDGVSSSIKATVKDLANANPLTVAITDANGDQITSFGGGTQYTEGDTDATIVGTAIMWEDTGNALTPVSSTKPLPVSATLDTTGLATSAKQDTIIGHVDGVEGLLTTIDADTGVLAGAVTAGKVQAEVTNSVAVTGTFFQATQPVSNAGTFAVQSTNQANSGVDIGDVTINNAAGASAVNIQDGGNAITVDNGGTFAVQAAQSGTWTVQPGNTANTTPWLVKEVRGATPAQTSPSVTNSTTSVLASNANRLGATIYNEGAATCYLKLGGTASTTSYSCQVASGGYYEVPFDYTGAIDGITSSGTAQLRVTEIT